MSHGPLGVRPVKAEDYRRGMRIAMAGYGVARVTAPIAVYGVTEDAPL